MRQAANWVRGWVEFQVTGETPEEFLNLCARCDLGFWKPRKVDGSTWVCRVSFLDWPKVPPLAERAGCQAGLLRRGGLPGLVWRARYRYVLLAGLALCLGAVAALGQFVWAVEVVGNETVPTGAILAQLRSQGLRPGAFGPGLDTRQIGNVLILDIPELSWASVNLRGAVCQVVVREGVAKPELVDETKIARVVAKYPGIVTRVATTQGQQMVRKGNTVAAGDTLINSYVDFEEPVGYNGDMGGITVRAKGRVWARTWHTLTAAIPLELEAKLPTGRAVARWSLEVLGRTVKFYPKGSISYAKYDKIASYYTASLPGGQALPLSLKRVVCREYQTQAVPVDPEEAEAILRDRLTRRLEQVVDGGEVLRTDWKLDRADGLLTLTLLAECEQEIGLTVEE